MPASRHPRGASQSRTQALGQTLSRSTIYHWTMRAPVLERLIISEPLPTKCPKEAPSPRPRSKPVVHVEVATGFRSGSQFARGWRINLSSLAWVRTTGSCVCGALPTTRGRIISTMAPSSWDRMWQCHTEVPPMLYWPTQTVM